MSERKLARIVTIDSVSPIEGADLIESAQVGGWNVVIKKSEFKVGEKVVYCEIDSMLPTEDSPFSFLSNRPQKLFDSKKYHKLKTIRLKGVVSQGLIVGIEQVNLSKDLPLDEDVSALLGIIKYNEEYFEPDKFAGDAFGNYPSFFPKTDQERIQNLSNKFPSLEGVFEVSMKLDGSSISVFKKDGEVGLTSRNIRLKIESEGTYKKGLLNSNILDFLNDNDNIVVQGELMGPGIQGNKEDLTEYTIFVFDIFDIKNNRYLLPEQRKEICDKYNIQHVPILGYVNIKDFKNVQEIVAYANGPSIKNKLREGLVFKAMNYDKYGCLFSFKAISNEWLLMYKK